MRPAGRETRRKAGGPFPEGWEFFKRAKGVLWFARRQASERDTFNILGLLPAKVPLDADFDLKRRQRRDVHELVSPNEDALSTVSSNSSSVSPLNQEEDLTAKERLRTSKQRYFESWEPKDVPWVLADAWTVSESEAPANLVGVLNVCATQRYYDAEEFQKEGVWTSWLKIDGGGYVPEIDSLQRWQSVWEEVWAKNAATITSCPDISTLKDSISRNKLQLPIVMLHCTHGVNRTGFVAVSLTMMNSSGRTFFFLHNLPIRNDRRCCFRGIW